MSYSQGCILYLAILEAAIELSKNPEPINKYLHAEFVHKWNLWADHLGFLTDPLGSFWSRMKAWEGAKELVINNYELDKSALQYLNSSHEEVLVFLFEGLRSLTVNIKDDDVVHWSEN
jgi:hypothetical protein